MAQDKSAKLDKPTYGAQVARLVRQRIRSGKLRGGDRISEASLADECGISRAPVREALYQLETEGLLMSHPKRGKCVTLLTGESIRNRYELCGLLEGAAAAEVALRHPDGPWPDLEDVLERMHQCVQENAPVDVHAELGTLFHETLLARASNTLVVGIARSSCRVISKYLMFQQWQHLYTTAELLQRHTDVYEALRLKDAQAIERAVRRHYAESAERLAALCPLPRSGRGSPRRRAHFPAE
ncbi:MAG: GntR family transcriptional regulator [Desulfovibrio sp.]|uniref:GntR family transcriptional regulator n=1 Tax=Desulfovibrio sp. TaxID=885 RepID=UPI001A7CA876|nr:GntR family transcriptional regulator [Desulfovibrio sp.]MBD5416275.1 GntR family transcriptional regulator [Desulfovibrio sp.]